MKRICLFISICASLFYGCEKVENESLAPDNSLVGGAGIKVFMSDQALKSGAESINPGDTIDLQRDLKVIFYCEDESMNPVRCYWMIQHEVSDYNIPGGPGVFTDYFGDQIGHSFPDFGVFKVTLKTFEYGVELISFYVYISGIPGKLGDDMFNNNVFRIEKKVYGQERLLFVFYKFAYPVSDGMAYASLYINGNPGSTQTIQLQRWPFSEANYWFYIIDDGPCYCYNACYAISYDNGQTFVTDQNMSASSWYDGVMSIRFALR